MSERLDLQKTEAQEVMRTLRRATRPALGRKVTWNQVILGASAEDTNQPFSLSPLTGRAWPVANITAVPAFSTFNCPLITDHFLPALTPIPTPAGISSVGIAQKTFLSPKERSPGELRKFGGGV